MITTSTRIIDGYTIEFRTYPKGDSLWRMNHQGRTTMWDGYVTDEAISTVIRAITSTKGRRIRLDI